MLSNGLHEARRHAIADTLNHSAPACKHHAGWVAANLPYLVICQVTPPFSTSHKPCVCAADSGVTRDIRRILTHPPRTHRSPDALADLIYENAPRATALSRCDGSPAEVYAVIEDTDQALADLRHVNAELRAIRQRHV